VLTKEVLSPRSAGPECGRSERLMIAAIIIAAIVLVVIAGDAIATMLTRWP
jgi:hypothetical protein